MQLHHVTILSIFLLLYKPLCTASFIKSAVMHAVSKYFIKRDFTSGATVLLLDIIRMRLPFSLHFPFRLISTQMYGISMLM